MYTENELITETDYTANTEAKKEKSSRRFGNNLYREAFACPECGEPAHQYGQSYKVQEGRKRTRKCLGCSRKFVTLEVEGEPEKLWQWVVEATAEQQRNFNRLYLVLSIDNRIPTKFFNALIRAGKKIGASPSQEFLDNSFDEEDSLLHSD